MTFGKAFALTSAVAGAFAVGVLAGPSITNTWSHSTPSTAITEPAPPMSVDVPTPTPRATVRTSPRPATAERAESTAAVVVPASTPELHQRLKGVLRQGAKMDVAADGFKSAEQFATVAHASRNTDVPFMLLKYRVVEEGKTVEAAIRESKPNLDVPAEVARAREQAREDVAALPSGN